MGVLCFLYIIAIYGYEFYFNKNVDGEFKNVYISAFLVSSIILFFIAWRIRKTPGFYEAKITVDRFTILYPGSNRWSFNVSVMDIKRFEHRNTLSHAGRGIGKSGILLSNGNFHEICMNYGNNINEMYDAIKSIKPDITFPKTVNLKVSGPINKGFKK